MRNPTTADLESEPQKFLSRSDWTLAASGGARVKLRCEQYFTAEIAPVKSAALLFFEELNGAGKDRRDNHEKINFDKQLVPSYSARISFSFTYQEESWAICRVR